MSSFERGDAVHHATHGHGVVVEPMRGDFAVFFASPHGCEDFTHDLDGWEKVETCTARERKIMDDVRDVHEARAAFRTVGHVIIADALNPENEVIEPGYIQVRVDDFDPEEIDGLADMGEPSTGRAQEDLLVRIGQAYRERANRRPREV